MLQYYPYKHVDRSRLYNIRELTGDMPFVQVKGHILSFETFKMSARKERVVAHFTDGSGKVMDLTWFNGGKYAKQSYKIGTEYIVFGRPNVFNGRINVTHPDIDAADKLELSAMGMQPYYNTTEKMKKGDSTPAVWSVSSKHSSTPSKSLCLRHFPTSSPSACTS